MAKQSKFFRVAVEGATVDGRKIERSWIADMASTYNRATYAARVNMEHIRGFSAEPPFNAYGDVLAVKAEEIDLALAGKTEKRLALFAQIEPTETLVTLVGNRQKLYTSIEIQPDFAGTGKAGLVGLAVTDSPASLGTEMLEFSAKLGDKSPLAARKQAPGNHFSVAEETAIEFEDAPAAPTAESAGFFAAAADFFKQFTPKAPEQQVIPPKDPVNPPANDNDARFAALGQGIDAMAQGMAAFTKEIGGKMDGFATKLTALEKQIDVTPEQGSSTRKPAAGGQSYALADC